jgi:hypothetical protein
MTSAAEAIIVGTNDEATRGSREPFVLEVSVADGAESIRVEADGLGLVLSNGTHWQQRLTREEAWRLAEAIDELATRQVSER